MPSAAERTRTLVQSTASAVLLVPGLDSARPDQLVPAERFVAPDGDLFLLFPSDSPVVRAATRAKDDELTAVLEITDVAPVAVPHRIRGRAWLTGALTALREPSAAGRTTLRLEVAEVSLDDLWGAEQVEPEDFAAADPDPLATHEAELLQHLAAAHDDQVAWLCALAGARGAATTAAPVALDRFGLRVRFRGEDGTFDARFEFPEPVGGVGELQRAIAVLFEAAHKAACGRQ